VTCKNGYISHEPSHLFSVLALLIADKAINMIQMASPEDPSITKLWQQAQAINSDLVNVSTNMNISCTPPWTDHGLV
jgi:hypothetical protein